MNTINKTSARRTTLIPSIFRYLLLLLLSVAIQLSACISFASSSTESMLVTAVVKSSCKINAGSVYFGVYDPQGANQTSPSKMSSDIKLRCVRGTTAQISIDSGTHYGKASSNTRSMASGDNSSYLAYELYKDQGETEVWDTNARVTQSTSTNTDMNVRLYAKIPANQNVPDGAYTDTLTVTVTY